MRGSWRERRIGSWFSRLWRPWVSLHPFRGRGRTINEPRPVGIRDLMASPNEVTAQPRRRWMVIGGFFFVLLVALILRLFFLQVVDYQASVKVVESNSLRLTTIPPTRGQIFDREDHALVTNVTTTEIRLSRALASLNPEVKGSLASLTGLSVKKINSDLNDKQYDPYQPAPIMSNAPASVVEFIKLHPKEFPGVSVLNASTRAYPDGGSLASQVLGYVGPNVVPHDGYPIDSTIGETGVESYYEQYLHGHQGTSTIEVNSLGSVLGVTNTTEPVVGDSVVLNIDTPLEQELDHYLQSEILQDRRSIDPVSGKVPQAINGAAIVMNPTNGEIYAMASYPSYNLNSFVTGLSTRQYDQLKSVGAFNNYAIQGLYTPGSTFKLATATTELQTGIISAYQSVNDTGTFTVPNCLKGTNHGCVFHDDDNQAAGHVDLPAALTVSSDYYFYNLGYLFWNDQSKYGQTPIQNVAAEYGLSQTTNVDLPYEAQGRVDSPQVRKDLHAQAPQDFPNATWYTGDNIEMAFGQGTTAITPIAMANAYATFANGGTRYAPQVAAAIVNPHGKIVLRYAPHVTGHVSLPPSVRDPILQGLTGVVDSPHGTGYSAFQAYFHHSLASFPIAGKTGTASNAFGEEPNSWFVGFGPTNHPQYVVLCVIDEGGYGADASAPVVAKTFNYLYSHPVPTLKLTSTLTTPVKKKSSTTTTATTSTSSTTTTGP
ncbi:MAG: penicillin-binding protein 2 [Acidimicrobiaceae bacterium]|nr:penicillin-binding protein 2 [Acidimicrobiaceae bacterium]